VRSCGQHEATVFVVAKDMQLTVAGVRTLGSWVRTQRTVIGTGLTRDVLYFVI
jgi:hypothetical protein